MGELLEAASLTKVYHNGREEVYALKDVSLSVSPGDYVSVVGPSGAGKSTTLHLIAGLLTPDRGEIRLDSRILYSSTGGVNLPARDRDVGLIFQESRLFPHLTVEENLLVGARAAKSVRRSIPFEQVVEILQLEKFRSRRPMTCSGGERQRIALGRALLAAPKYLLMDEPLAALDIAERWRILSALREVQRQLHLPVLYVSHDPGMVLNFADRMILLRNGAIEGQGDPFTRSKRSALPPPGALHWRSVRAAISSTGSTS